MLSQRQKEDLIAAVLAAVGELEPEEVFDSAQLEEWALEHGFTKDEE